MIYSRFLLAVFVLFISGVEFSAQDTRDQVDCQTAAKVKRPKNRPSFSFGVINGRARVLVKPEYPPAATFVKVRGSVNVSVLIDPRGCIAEAKVTSGHPLLRAASVRAALKSSFEPVLLSGNPSWVYGVIVYNYVE